MEKKPCLVYILVAVTSGLSFWWWSQRDYLVGGTVQAWFSAVCVPSRIYFGWRSLRGFWSVVIQAWFSIAWWRSTLSF